MLVQFIEIAIVLIISFIVSMFVLVKIIDYLESKEDKWFVLLLLFNHVFRNKYSEEVLPERV